MTDAPRTTMLTGEEWRSLCIGSAQQLAGFFANVVHPTPDALAALDEHVERLRMFARAWGATPMLQQAQQRSEGLTEGATRLMNEQVEAGLANGKASPKRKGGWPKGRKRKPRGEPAGEAVQ